MISTILNMSDDSNKGDLAIIESTIWLVKKHFPKTKICVLNGYSGGKLPLIHLSHFPLVILPKGVTLCQIILHVFF